MRGFRSLSPKVIDQAAPPADPWTWVFAPIGGTAVISISLFQANGQMLPLVDASDDEYESMSITLTEAVSVAAMFQGEGMYLLDSDPEWNVVGWPSRAVGARIRVISGQIAGNTFGQFSLVSGLLTPDVIPANLVPGSGSAYQFGAGAIFEIGRCPR